ALAEAAVALGAHQCGLRAAAGARPAVGTAGVAAAAGLRAAGAAVRQCPDRAGAAVSDRPSDPSGIGRAARRTRPAVSLRRSRLRPGQRTAAAGAGLSAGAVPRGGDGAAELSDCLAAQPAAAQLPGAPAQPVAAAAG